MTEQLAFRPATELAELLRRKELSSVELTRHYIERIERHDGALNAVVVRRFAQALEEAAVADAALARGRVPRPTSRSSPHHQGVLCHGWHAGDMGHRGAAR